MFRQLQAWRARRAKARADQRAELERQQTAIERALEYFKRSRDVEPMHGIVLAGANDDYVVRVMYMTNHVPPDRAWFRLQHDSISELSFDEVKHIDTVAWR